MEENVMQGIVDNFIEIAIRSITPIIQYYTRVKH